MGEITIDEILERGIKLPEDRLSFPVEEFEKQKGIFKGKGGVYTFTSRVEGFLYVGVAKDLALRLSHHIKGSSTGNKGLHEKLKYSGVILTVYRESNQSLRELYENYLILTNNPKFNVSKKSVESDGHSSKIKQVDSDGYSSKIKQVDSGRRKKSKCEIVERNAEIVRMWDVDRLNGREIGEKFNLTASSISSIVRQSSQRYGKTVDYFENVRR